MTNFISDNTGSVKNYSKEFDALPIQVKAAAWDNVIPYGDYYYVRLWRKTLLENKNNQEIAIRVAVNTIKSWDGEEVRSKKTSVLWAGRKRFSKTVPASPHIEAGITVLRGYENLYAPMKSMA